LESLNALSGGEPDLDAHEAMVMAFGPLDPPIADADLKLWAEEHAWHREFQRSAIAAAFAASRGRF
jgi:hypothetical protein